MGVVAEGAKIDGTATYRERIALPPNAVFEALLQDVTIADASAPEIARTTSKKSCTQEISKFASISVIGLDSIFVTNGNQGGCYDHAWNSCCIFLQCVSSPTWKGDMRPDYLLRWNLDLMWAHSSIPIDNVLGARSIGVDKRPSWDVAKRSYR